MVDETKKTRIVRREQKEAEVMELMEQRQRFAVAGVRLEQYLESADQPSYDKFADQVDLSIFPESVQARFRRLFDQFVEFQEQVSYAKEVLRFEYGLEFIEPKKDGRRFFIGTCEHEPEGEIALIAGPAFFTILVEKQADYWSLIPGDWEIVDNEKMALSGGMFRPRAAMYMDPNGPIIFCDEEDWEAGIEPEDDAVRAPAVFVNNFWEDDLQHTADKTYIHEKQHAINHYFADNKDSYFEFTNEILARIREGVRPEDIIPSLASRTYVQLYDQMSDAEVARVNRLIAHTVEAFAAFEKLFSRFSHLLSGGELRALATYHLIDTPLQRYPARLELMRRFFQKKLAPLEEIFSELDYKFAIQDSYHVGIGRERYPEETQLLIDKLVAHISQLDDLYLEALRAILLSDDAKKQTSALQALSAAVEVYYDLGSQYSEATEEIDEEEDYY